MSLRNSLYTAQKRETDGQTEWNVRFNSAHPIFAGHFPGHPVVPGACLVSIAEELLAENEKKKVCFTSVKNLKFRQPITPDMEVTVTINAAEGNARVQINDYANFQATYMCADSDL